MQPRLLKELKGWVAGRFKINLFDIRYLSHNQPTTQFYHLLTIFQYGINSLSRDS